MRLPTRRLLLLLSPALFSFTLGPIEQRAAEPELFAPGVISTAADELNAAFTPDQRTLFFPRACPRIAWA